MKTVFLRVLKASDKAEGLLEAVRGPANSSVVSRFDVDVRSFSAVPSSPFAYWVGEKLLSRFIELPRFETEERIALGGLKTLDDERFVRAWWELPSLTENTWPNLAKGGAFSPFYADVYLRVNWKTQGEEISWYGYQRRPREGFGAASRGVEAYFRQGLTWSRRTDGLSLRILPAGCVFADKGPAAFVKNDSAEDLLALAAVTNSSAFSLLVSLQLGRTELAQSYEVGLIQRTPIPNLNHENKSALAKLARRAWSLKRSLDKLETSHAFVLPALLQMSGETLSSRVTAWNEHSGVIETEIAAIRDKVDSLCFELYGMNEVNPHAIIEEFADEADHSNESSTDPASTVDQDDDEGISEATDLVAELVSWAAGVAVGRYDIRVATGAHAFPPEPDPFDPLPACSPAMLMDGSGNAVTVIPDDYPIRFPESGILVDDPGSKNDFFAAIESVFSKVFQQDDEHWLTEIEAKIDPDGRDLRKWLAGKFFEYHVKRHSKSRRKAPLLWQLTIPSKRYSIWLYAQRLNRDSFVQILNDVLAPKLAHEERRLLELSQFAGTDPSVKDRKDIEDQEGFVEELREMTDEVKLVAPLWFPSLEDGVLLAMAPLWRLVAQRRPWQSELKVKWSQLAAGDLDWSRLAMQFWPERVVPKCATDRSLAMAHGLDAFFWFKDDNRWKPYATPKKSIEELVREREQSAAAKAALKRLVETTGPTVVGKRPRKSKAS